MARKDEYKPIHIPNDLHASVSDIADQIGLSITKVTEMLLRKAVKDVTDADGLSFTVKKTDNGAVLELN